MYDPNLALKILGRLDHAFPTKLNLHELRAVLQECEGIPLEKWLSTVQALRLEGKVNGEFLLEDMSVTGAGALSITEIGRSQLRQTLPPVGATAWEFDRYEDAHGLMAQMPDGFREQIIAIEQAELADPKLRRKSDRQIADRAAMYDRRLSGNEHQWQKQESLLRDARVWASEELRTAIAQGKRTVQELKARVVRQTWDEFVRAHAFHSDLRLGYRQFASAVWDEGWPSLNDLARRAIRNRARQQSDGDGHPANGTSDDLSGDLRRQTEVHDPPDAKRLLFPDRAEWLRLELIKRGWNKHDICRHAGPDPKTVQKILDGAQVREEVLRKLAAALSDAPIKLPPVDLLKIPRS